ncbi:MAG: Nramp family divalent metal transporter [Bacteroidales bacterium]
MLKLRKRLLNILFWSVISAAFIGPGTVTTCTKAGAVYGYDLLWAIVFSTFACVLLQETSARLTIISGLNLGQAIARQFEGKPSRFLILGMVVGAIILGSAAYETGNIVGSVIGLRFIIDVPNYYLIIGTGILAYLALSLKSVELIARIMGGIVFLMGIAFFTTAIQVTPSYSGILHGSLIPKIPESGGAGLIILGLIGTTVVPYDLFLGSGVLDKKQTIFEMRFGVSVAVILGGLISMAIMVVGTLIKGEFTYEALSLALTTAIGPFAVYVFGFGMFAAGFSSAITAPLASAITARSLFFSTSNKKWMPTGCNFKLLYFSILLVGLGFGFLDVEPIPAIILAQAFNGLILPFISIFLIFVINDPVVMGKENTNSLFHNVLMSLVMWVTMIIGLINIFKASVKVFKYTLPAENDLILIISIISLIASIGIIFALSKFKRKRALSL